MMLKSAQYHISHSATIKMTHFAVNSAIKIYIYTHLCIPFKAKKKSCKTQLKTEVVIWNGTLCTINKQKQWYLLLWTTTAIIGRRNKEQLTLDSGTPHAVQGVDMGSSCWVELWVCQREFCANTWRMTSQARRAMSEVECTAGYSGPGSYLLLFVGFGSPAPNRTSPASIDCRQVLPSTLFTVQFNHILEGRSP